MSRNSSCVDYLYEYVRTNCFDKIFSKARVQPLGPLCNKVSAIASSAARTLLQRMVLLPLLCGVDPYACGRQGTIFKLEHDHFRKIKAKRLHWAQITFFGSLTEQQRRSPNPATASCLSCPGRQVDVFTCTIPWRTWQEKS